VRDDAGAARDHAGTARDDAGAARDHAGAARDEAAEKRDRDAAASEAWLARGGVCADTVDSRSEARREAAADRKISQQDRTAGAGERSEAEIDRETASADRRAGAGERIHAEFDRDTASADRLAGAIERSEAELDRSTARADRGAGASERSEAELDRDTAQADRGAGASERSEAELDRDTAQADRGASALERAHSSHDDLTGVYARGAGFLELKREIARARRTTRPLVLAFVDVDGLKAVNDSHGHAAGDRMLLAVADALQTHVRAHDLVIRYGGDEFLCVVSGLDLAEAGKRFALVNAGLADGPQHGTVTVGLAQLRADERPEDLVARADAELYRERQRQRRPPA
jgi:diguanylate cyclase (GGDEF)-like protein